MVNGAVPNWIVTRDVRPTNAVICRFKRQLSVKMVVCLPLLSVHVTHQVHALGSLVSAMSQNAVPTIHSKMIAIRATATRVGGDAPSVPVRSPNASMDKPKREIVTNVRASMEYGAAPRDCVRQPNARTVR